MSLPAICAELRLRADGKVALVNSRDVAEVFEKRHDHVLRDINALDISPELGRSWFRGTTFRDSYGREQPSVDMTRDGFTLLVMGWTGERAMAFKVRYIEAFNAMEKALNEGAPVTGSELIQAVREKSSCASRRSPTWASPTEGSICTELFAWLCRRSSFNRRGRIPIS